MTGVGAALTGRGLIIKNVAEHEIREEWVEAAAEGKLVFQETVLKAIQGAAYGCAAERRVTGRRFSTSRTAGTVVVSCAPGPIERHALVLKQSQGMSVAF